MRILPFAIPKAGITMLAASLFACLCAVPFKPLETVTLAAAVQTEAEKDSSAKPATVKGDQTITFARPSSRHVGDAPFEAGAVASSGLEVTLVAAGHCSVTGATVHLDAVGSCTLTASQDGDDEFNAAPSVSQSFFIANNGETVVDLSAFGAVGDAVANDSPALQQALDALGAAQGGTLFVPPGHYALLTPVSKDFALASVAIRGVESDVTVVTTGTGNSLAEGLGLVSEFLPRTGETGVALSINGAPKLLIADIAFVGTPDVDTDALATLAISDIAEATIRHCEFYGLR
ncbi:MAG TPA: glycosyl hydrolase family 28-related protein, partial [Pyrinomonadaceae bacterium]